MLSVTGSFDSGSPQQDGIENISDQTFHVKAYSETKREAFRLDLMLENSSSESQDISIKVTWSVTDFSELRDMFYMKHNAENEWTPVAAGTAEGKSFISCNIKPGKSCLCLHPQYSLGDCEKFIAKLEHPHLRKSILATSNAGRSVHLLSFCNNFDTGKKPVILVTARNHANESSGNYCVEGMCEWLMSKDALAVYILSKLEVCILPMTNVDGVADGMARYSCPKGADYNRTPEWNIKNRPDALPDKAHEAIFSFIEESQPAGFLNLHSYLFKHKDELYAPTLDHFERFTRFVPDQVEHGKVWRCNLSEDSTFPTRYCYEKYGTNGFIVEVPWFQRSISSMKNFGAKLLQALVLMDTVKQSNSWGCIANYETHMKKQTVG